jgi:hypothetical protein
VASIATPPPPEHQGLPDVLFQSAQATVEHGTDPGDYYCEHVFFNAQATAAKTPSVAKNAEGEKLVGFLHCPPDAWTETKGGKYAQADRHAGTREVVGAALKGYFEDAAPSVKTDPVKILLTGFGPFMSIEDNPTGDFVTHPENIDAALAQSFGKDLLTPKGKPVKLADGAQGLVYQVRDAVTGKTRTLEVATDKLAVADATLDPRNPRSIERAIADVKPNAVLSMGVAGPGSYLAEHHADDGGMRPTADGGWKHVDGAPQTRSQPDNYSLARAILRGQPAPLEAEGGDAIV